MRLSFFLFLLPIYTFAEYRAYELTIINSANGKTRTVISNMDQYQYPEYKHLSSGEMATYVTSWMCYGRTNNLSICSKPESTMSTPAAPAQNLVTPNASDPALQTR
ncbi:MAG: hypothetical protein A4S09_12400 [Proteobacteria bacterium SG_bin7]|nr:MAG: hypothetical protein A4S09_12400 [Proteobacteria bacterium SG_bin7]